MPPVSGVPSYARDVAPKVTVGGNLKLLYRTLVGHTAWGAGLEGSPVVGSEGSEIESTVLFVPVRRWSDGSPAPAPTEPHTHTK